VVVRGGLVRVGMVVVTVVVPVVTALAVVVRGGLVRVGMVVPVLAVVVLMPPTRGRREVLGRWRWDAH